MIINNTTNEDILRNREEKSNTEKLNRLICDLMILGGKEFKHEVKQEESTFEDSFYDCYEHELKNGTLLIKVYEHGSVFFEFVGKENILRIATKEELK